VRWQPLDKDPTGCEAGGMCRGMSRVQDSRRRLMAVAARRRSRLCSMTAELPWMRPRQGETSICQACCLDGLLQQLLHRAEAACNCTLVLTGLQHATTCVESAVPHQL
jgi:hypothetical protein